MFTKVLFGRYVPTNSLIHKMDPRNKLSLSILFIILIFFANNWQTYLLLTLVTIASILLTRVSLKFFWDGVRPLIWIILFTVLLQIIFSSGGHVYWHWGILSITQFGLKNGLFIFIRFVLIICISTVLTLTTQPLMIADAVEYLLAPLKKVKVPVAQLALMLSIALRFVPTLLDETQKIMNSQRARGVDFASGGLIKRIKSVIPIMIPLFISAFKRAEDLATAMEARGYRDSDQRTKYRILQWHRRDTIAVSVFVVIVVLLFILRVVS
ncbi:energy-coupling factor transporter transmembrane component T family protein [Paucilactobacillus sp. N302-9]